jgi:hypothetical protein
MNIVSAQRTSSTFKQKPKTSAKLKILHEAALILNSGKKDGSK